MENTKEITPFFRIIGTCWRQRKFIIIFNSIIIVITIIILLITPNKYRSNALITIEEKSGGLPIPSILKDLPISLSIGGSEKIEKYIRYGKSRRVLDFVIDKRNLDKIYNAKYREDTYKAFLGDFDIIDNGDGTFTISFAHEDKILASEVVQDVYEQIRLLDIEISNQKATDFRQFLEKRTTESYNKLMQFEDSLKSFSEVSGIIEIEEQIKQSIKLLSDLESKKLELEIQRDFLRKNVQNDFSTFRQLDEKVNVIDQKIKKIYQSDVYSNLAINDLPEQSLKYYRLYRNVKVQELIMEFLIPQLENAKIEEKKNYSSLVLIDHPVPAERKNSPKRLTTLFIISFISFIGSIIIVRIREIYQENHTQLKSILLKNS